MLKALAIIAVIAAPLPAFGQVVSERADSVSIVIYPETDFGGLVMVTERRTVDLPAGPLKVEFRGVADGIIPQTAAVEGLPGRVREQNFDFNLLTPGSLISRSQGRDVTLVRTNPSTGRVTEERAKIVSAGQGTALDIGGRVEAFKCSRLPERIVFDRLPEGLGDKPSLSLETVSPVAGRRTLALSYLAAGVSWQANYVATLDSGAKQLSLDAWITIANDSGATFADAPVQVLAGRLNLTEETEVQEVEGEYLETNCWPDPNWTIPSIVLQQVQSLGAVAEMARSLDEDGQYVEEIISTGTFIRASDLGDYKLYSLPGRTTVAAHQSKQVRMFTRDRIPFDARYRFEFASIYGGSAPPTAAQLVLTLNNTEAAGLGLPLPKGEVAVFTPVGRGRRGYAGETSIGNIPSGLPVELDLGEEDVALVQAATRIISDTERGGLATVEVETVVTNALSVPVVVRLGEAETREDFKITGLAQPQRQKGSHIEWEVEVGSNSSVALTYTLQGRR